MMFWYKILIQKLNLIYNYGLLFLINKSKINKQKLLYKIIYLKFLYFDLFWIVWGFFFYFGGEGDLFISILR